ncbi:MAG: thioredoxin family protein [Mariniblastus sp.]|nr:thioredoxin family protein [Mariniblastus sp.]
MIRTLVWGIGLTLLWGSFVEAHPQRDRQRAGQRGARQMGGQPDGKRDLLGDADSNPLAIGDAGVAWYTTWETGLAEAQRSNRPIFFMSAATTCSGVPGVF